MRKEKKVELKTNHPLKDINESELVDISTVKINTDLPVKERIKDYIRQIKNPYCYLDHGVVVTNKMVLVFLLSLWYHITQFC